MKFRTGSQQVLLFVLKGTSMFLSGGLKLMLERQKKKMNTWRGEGSI